MPRSTKVKITDSLTDRKNIGKTRNLSNVVMLELKCDNGLTL